MLAKLRGRTAELRIETGRWFGLNRDEWIGKNCDKGALAFYCVVCVAKGG